VHQEPFPKKACSEASRFGMSGSYYSSNRPGEGIPNSKGIKEEIELTDSTDSTDGARRDPTASTPYDSEKQKAKRERREHYMKMTAGIAGIGLTVIKALAGIRNMPPPKPSAKKAPTRRWNP
jgi:hypothetical protein